MASLSDQETAFVSDLQRVLSSPGADDQYDQREESYGGRLLNADLARELSRDYRTKFDRRRLPFQLWTLMADITIKT